MCCGASAMWAAVLVQPPIQSLASSTTTSSPAFAR